MLRRVVVRRGIYYCFPEIYAEPEETRDSTRPYTILLPKLLKNSFKDNDKTIYRHKFYILTVLRNTTTMSNIRKSEFDSQAFSV